MKTVLLIAVWGLALAAAAGADAPSPQALLDAASAAGAARVTIPPGVYRQAETLRIGPAHDLEIVAEGVTLVLTSFENAVALRDCRRVTLRGLRLDYDPLAFTQGSITAVDPAAKSFNFELHAGYPDLTPDYAVPRAHLFDAAGAWKPGAPDLYGQTEIVDARHGRFRLRELPPQVAVGDQVALNQRVHAALTVQAGCEDLHFQDLEFSSTAGLAILGRFALGGDRFTRVRIRPGPPPAGATRPRLLSATADGLNYAYVRRGPTLEDCEFARLGDDSVNLHSSALPVYRVLDGQRFLTLRPHGVEDFAAVLRPGDPLRFLAAETFAPKGEGVLSSLAVVEGESLTAEALTRLYPAQATRQGRPRATVYLITSQTPLPPLAEGDFLDLPAIGCPGFAIRGCYFHDHRARGIRCMASHGVIENNRLERLQQTGISLGPEYLYWREAGWVEDVTVRGNTLRQIGFGARMQDPRYYAPGALSVFAHVAPQADGTFYPGNRNLAFLNNRFEACPVPAIRILAGSSIEQRGNSESAATPAP